MSNYYSNLSLPTHACTKDKPCNCVTTYKHGAKGNHNVPVLLAHSGQHSIKVRTKFKWFERMESFLRPFFFLFFVCVGGGEHWERMH